jgi:uncharacterized protein involved in exopolysaccharide biosynthesis
VAAIQPMLPQQESASAGISIAQVYSILKAYYRQTAIIVFVIALSTAVIVKMMPKMYLSTATLIVNYEVNDPLGGKEFPLFLLGSYMSTQIEIMLSGDVLIPVVEKLKLTEDKDYVAGYRDTGTSTLEEYAKEGLIRNLSIRSGNQLIYISATARTPIMAAEIANAVADVYSEQQLKRLSGPASERAKRYSSQLAELKTKVNLAQEQVTEFRKRTGITDVGAKNDGEMLLLNTLEQRYQDAQNQRRAMESHQLGSLAVNPRGVGAGLVQQFKTQLANQESQMAQLRSTLGPNHPKVLELQAQMESTRQTLAEETQISASGTSSELDGAKQLESKLKAAVEEQRTKVLAERNVQDEGTKLLLELESAQSVYKRALDGYDQIMFASAGHYTNVSFLSRAQPPLQAAKPNKLKFLTMGVAAGLFLGFAGPLCYELFVNRRVRTRHDWERDLGLPVLAEFDALVPTGSAT